MKETQQQVRRIHSTLVGRMARLLPQLSAMALGRKGAPGASPRGPRLSAEGAPPGSLLHHSRERGLVRSSRRESMPPRPMGLARPALAHCLAAVS